MNRPYRRLLFSLLVLLFTSRLPAQANPGKNYYLSFSPGISADYVRDDQASPMRYQGILYPFRLTCFFSGNNSRHTIRLFYSGGTLQSAPQHSADIRHLSGSYQYFKRLQKFGDGRNEFFLGGKWDFQSVVRKYRYSRQSFPEQFRNDFSSLTIDLMFRFPVKSRIFIETSFGFPFLTYMIHSGYAYERPDKLIIKQDYSVPDYLTSGTFTTINRFRSIFFTAHAGIKISVHFRLAIDYHFLYYRYPKPRLLKFAAHQISTGLIRSF